MAEVKWIKITTDMFDNRKIKHLRKLPEGNSIVLIWVMLLTMAGRCNANGMIFLTENIPYTPKMLADELDFEENTVLLALEALERLNMMEMKEGFFSITGWEEHQNAERLAEIREKERLKKRRQREKAMLTDSSEVSRDKTGDKTGDNEGTSPSCPAIEEEEEGDLEKEKEFHSINQAAQTDFSFANVEKSVENTRRSYLNGTLGKGVVLLSDEQFNDLMEKLSFDEFNKYVGIVAEQELAGKHYRKKTHYQAILDMAMEDRKTR